MTFDVVADAGDQQWVEPQGVQVRRHVEHGLAGELDAVSGCKGADPADHNGSRNSTIERRLRGRFEV